MLYLNTKIKEEDKEMICPECSSSKIKVLEKRNAEGEHIIRRRRECSECSFRFTTYERIEAPFLIVIKKDGRKESFSKEKLTKGIAKSLEKRPVTPSKIEEIVNSIERDLRAEGSSEIKSKQIGKVALKALKEVDDVAYLRFASVYKSFADVESFKKELEEITKV